MKGNWKLVVRTHKASRFPEGRVLVEKAILEAAHLPWKLREARRRLFILTNGASQGQPALIETEGGFVCLISLDDLIDIVMDPPPTLSEIMLEARAHGKE
ncbi:hypothetical protein HJB88_12475 [Rhizobium sp. NZLR5]|uniref:hypothetical protein n=1 Tax=unclassified Rhizobium TaxID=2613769 RepID=UPI001C8340CB|nr:MULTISPECIES: hypothetical protein [unclassified Rhizobium]MBX5183449.1 hypothetical protein [Rhizobium sp. NZLR5]MBX5198268.1 hypothetical protein [Rhizobium sp. NZLR10]